MNLKSYRLRAWNPAQLSALLRERTIRPLPNHWLQDRSERYGLLPREDMAAVYLDELLTRWPRTVPERIDRTLCNLAVLSRTAGQDVEIGKDDIPLAFAETPNEAQFHVRCLMDRAYVRDSGSSHDGFVVELTADGWERYEELTRGASAPENPVFVAMWFGADDESDAQLTKTGMKDLYRHAIGRAVEKAGYHVTRVDLHEHNEWIMDKVLGDIQLAPFVVADFTGNRNGVYFEAGFARGLGIPVIHTCHEGHLKDAHFDTKQLNHVLWKTPEELHERLYHRIMATIGRGPHLPPAATSFEQGD